MGENPVKFKNQIFLGQFTNPLQHCRHVKYARRIFEREIFKTETNKQKLLEPNIIITFPSLKNRYIF